LVSIKIFNPWVDLSSLAGGTKTIYFILLHVIRCNCVSCPTLKPYMHGLINIQIPKHLSAFVTETDNKSRLSGKSLIINQLCSKAFKFFSPNVFESAVPTNVLLAWGAHN
jgi:hypothetical protein